MGRIKLPRSLFKVLFPSRRKSSSSSSSSTTSTSVGRGGGDDGASAAAAAGRGRYPRYPPRERGDPFSSPSSPFSLPPGPQPNVDGERRYDEFVKSVMDPEPATDHGSPPPPPPVAASSPVTVDVKLSSTPSTVADPSDERSHPPPLRTLADVTHARRSDAEKEEKERRDTLRREEARARAVVRQRRILSSASSRLDAISNTSLEGIEEASRSEGSRRSRASPDFFAEKAASGEMEPSGKESGKPETSAPSSPYDFLSKEFGREMAVELELASPDDLIVAPPPPSAPSEAGEEDGSDAAGSVILLYESPVVDLDGHGQVQGMERSTEVNDASGGKDGEPSITTDACHPAKAGLREEGEASRNDDAKRQDDDDDEGNIQFFILLLCPTSRIFELIEISAGDSSNNASTIRDVLELIPQKCTDERLLQKQYCGFVRPSDRSDFAEPDDRAFVPVWPSEAEYNDQKKDQNDRGPVPPNTIGEGDVLVAIIEGHSGREMSKISKPILRNSKFRDMIRRRRRGKERGSSNGWDDDDKSTRSNRFMRASPRRRERGRGNSMGGGLRYSRSNGKASPPRVECLEAEIDFNHHEGGKTPRSSNQSRNGNKEKESDRYSSLCQKLEHLSKKLDYVDDEIAGGGAAEEEDATKDGEGEISSAEEVTASNPEASFKMTPEMVAHELAANIEDIFAGHNVQIVAVDAEQQNDNSDDDTFATAQSKRSARSARSAAVCSLVEGRELHHPLGKDDEMPMLEITTKKKASRKSRRRGRSSKFESYGEDDMMLQIEAMARQADAAFERRRKNPGVGDRGGGGTTIIEPDIDSVIIRPEIHVIDGTVDVDETTDTTTPQVQEKTNDDREEANLKKVQRKSVSFTDEVNTTPGDASVAVKLATIRGASSTYAASSQHEALSRNLLDLSPSVVSTMVVNPHGGINEVHALQYLGVPIVCIAANFVQQQQECSRGQHNVKSREERRDTFGVKEVFQSAMFLAFMVNGQRYLAKVTKK